VPGRARDELTFLPFAGFDGFDDRPLARRRATFAGAAAFRVAERAGWDARADALAADFFDAAAERAGRDLLGIVAG
jgi:hypothetical protein